MGIIVSIGFSIYSLSLYIYIRRPFPLCEVVDHILAGATIAPRDTPHLKPRPVQDWHGGYFPLNRLLRHAGTTVGLFFFSPFRVVPNPQGTYKVRSTGDNLSIPFQGRYKTK